jgi:hypothetical protein
MNQPTLYTFPEGLLQAVVNNLYAQPASQSHELLNAIKAECTRQEQERAQAQRDAERKAIEQELKGKLDAALVPEPPPELRLPLINE